jgi:hypothetical protein
VKHVITTTCERIVANNGTVEVLFTRRSDGRTHEGHINLMDEIGAKLFEEGEQYRVTFERINNRQR